MYEVLTTSQIINYLLEDEYANWTFEEAQALANFYESLEYDMNENIQFDRVAIRCDWNSYDGLADLLSNWEDLDESVSIQELRDYFGEAIAVTNYREDGTFFITYLVAAK